MARKSIGVKLSKLIQTIIRKPYRRTAVDQSTLQDITIKVNAARKKCESLSFSVPFGGYKHSDLPCSPHLNWAEVFWLDYLRSYAEPIVKLHPPGVVFSLSYMSGVLAFINNYPAAYQTLYIAELQRLCSLASCSSIRFEIVDIADFYGGPEKALEAVERRYQSFMMHWPVSSDAKKHKLASAARNITSTDPDDICTAAMRCDAMESLEQRRRFNKYGHHIQLSHLRSSLSLHIGSASGTVVQPWVGVGILSQGKGRIISGGQWQSASLRNIEVSNLALPLSSYLQERIKSDDWSGLLSIPVD